MQEDGQQEQKKRGSPGSENGSQFTRWFVHCTVLTYNFVYGHAAIRRSVSFHALKETASDSFYKVFVLKGGQQYAVYRRYQSGPEAA